MGDEIQKLLKSIEDNAFDDEEAGVELDEETSTLLEGYGKANVEASPDDGELSFVIGDDGEIVQPSEESAPAAEGDTTVPSDKDEVLADGSIMRTLADGRRIRTPSDERLDKGETIVRTAIPTAANAVTGNLADNALDAVGAEGAAETLRDSREELYDASVTAGLIAEGAGSFIPGALALKGASVAVKGTGKIASAGRLALAGGAEGALFAAGTPENIELENVLKGGGAGAVLGPVGGKLVEVGTKSVAKAGVGVTNIMKELLKLRNRPASANQLAYLSKRISDQTEGRLTQMELLKRVNDGEPLHEIVADYGVTGKDFKTLIGRVAQEDAVTMQKLSEVTGTQGGDIRKFLDKEATKVSDVVDTAVDTAGKQTDKILRAVKGEDVSEITAGLINRNDSANIEPVILDKITDQLKDTNSELLAEMGYRGGGKVKIELDLETGEPFLIRKGAIKGDDGLYAPDDIESIASEIDATIFRRSASDVDARAAGDFKQGAVKDQDLGFELSETSRAIRESAEEQIPGLKEANIAYKSAKEMESVLKASENIFRKGANAETKDVRAFVKTINDSSLSRTDKLKLIESGFQGTYTADKVKAMSPILKEAINDIEGGDILTTNLSNLVDELETLAITSKSAATGIPAYENFAESMVKGSLETINHFTALRQASTNLLIALAGGTRRVANNHTVKNVRSIRRANAIEVLQAMKPEHAEEALEFVMNDVKTKDVITDWAKKAYLLSQGVTAATIGDKVDPVQEKAPEVDPNNTPNPDQEELLFVPASN